MPVSLVSSLLLGAAVLTSCGGSAVAQDGSEVLGEELVGTGRPEVFEAVVAGDLERVRALTEDPASLKALDANGWTPLHRAALAGRTEVVRYLLEAGSDPAWADPRTHETALHSAARAGDAEAVRALLDAGAPPGAVNTSAQAPLHLAANFGSLEAVRALVEAGVDADQASPGFGTTPLFFAAANGEEAVVSFLLAEGADLDTVASSGATPLLYACRYAGPSTALLLIEAGADVHRAIHQGGDRALHIAAGRGWLDVCRALLEHGADPGARMRNGWKPADHAILRGFAAAARLVADGSERVRVPRSGIGSPRPWLLPGDRDTVQPVLNVFPSGRVENLADEVLWDPLAAAPDPSKLRWDLEGLAASMQEEDGLPRSPVVLRPDASVEWVHVARLLVELSGAELWNVWLAVETLDGEHEGNVPVPLPRDVPDEPVEVLGVQVSLVDAEGDADGEGARLVRYRLDTPRRPEAVGDPRAEDTRALFAPLRNELRRRSEEGLDGALVSVRPGVRYDEVVLLLEQLWSFGFVDVQFAVPEELIELLDLEPFPGDEPVIEEWEIEKGTPEGENPFD